MEAIQRLRAVLCDPEGNVCISGSDGDRREITEGLAELEREPAAAQATAERLREVLHVVKHAHDNGYSYNFDCELYQSALALPADRTALDAMLAEARGYQFISLSERMPDPAEHPRVLIYTEGSEFGGEQFFDVTTDSLNECFYREPHDQPEVCRHATHWALLPEIRQAAERSE